MTVGKAAARDPGKGSTGDFGFVAPCLRGVDEKAIDLVLFNVVPAISQTLLHEFPHQLPEAAATMVRGNSVSGDPSWWAPEYPHQSKPQGWQQGNRNSEPPGKFVNCANLGVGGYILKPIAIFDEVSQYNIDTSPGVVGLVRCRIIHDEAREPHREAVVRKPEGPHSAAMLGEIGNRAIEELVKRIDGWLVVVCTWILLLVYSAVRNSLGLTQPIRDAVQRISGGGLADEIDDR